VLLPQYGGMPPRVRDADEAIYAFDGVLTVHADGISTEVGVGSFADRPRGFPLLMGRTPAPRVPTFHIPGGFDRALANGGGSRRRRLRSDR
jgi:hypothetical protein